MIFELDKLIELAKQKKQQLLICFIANVKEATTDFDDYSKDSVIAEFLSIKQYHQILSTLSTNGYLVQAYNDEGEFIKDCTQGKFTNSHQVLVINSAQKGTSIGRKALIPSICDFYGFWYVGSNPYLRCLLRDKYKTNCILEKHEIPCSKSYLYLSSEGWLLGKKPQNGDKVIAKLNFEASSIGLSERNVFIYSKEKENFIDQLANDFAQPVIVQEFISGYEVEFPFISSKNIVPCIPVSLYFGKDKKMGNNILTYELRSKRDYHFCDYRDINPEISESMANCSQDIIRILGISDLCRIDYRVTEDGKYYVTDIATNPGYTKVTSINYSFSLLGYDYSQILDIMIGSALERYYDGI